MGTSFDGVDVVDIGVNVLAVVGIVHHSHLDRNVLLLGFEIDHIVEEMRAMTVHIANKLFQSVFGMERLGLCFTVFIKTKIGERNFHTGIQVSQLAHSRRNNFPFIGSGRKNLRIWPELLTGSAQRCLANHLDGIKRFTLFIFLLVDLSIAKHLRLHVAGQGVDTAHAHAMQASAHLIRALVELTSCV